MAPVGAKAQDLNLVGNIRAIKAEIGRLQGLLDEATAELLGKRATTTTAASKRAVAANKTRAQNRILGGHHPSNELVPDSAAFWASEVIRGAGRPLHSRDLVKAIGERGHKVKETTLLGTLYRWVKRKSVFYRAGKSTFGLIEMKKG
jgi:hypothetical protein